MLKGACCVAVAVLLFVPLAFCLRSCPVPPTERAALANEFVDPDRCCPEPGERLAYMAGIVFFPLCLFTLALVCRRWAGLSSVRPVLAWSVEIALAVGLAAFTWRALQAEDCRYLQWNLFYKYPPLTLLLLPAALAALRSDPGARWPVRPALNFLALALATVPFLATLQNDKSLYNGAPHFNAVFFPMVEVFQGKALLVESSSQYGLYPHLLQPLFALTGLSVLGFTCVLGLLLAASYAALWAFLTRACNNHSVAFLGFASLLVNGWFAFFGAGSFDPYFQYLPIRFVIPALLVPLGWRYLRRPTLVSYWLLLVFLAVGVLWNLDSGAPAMLSWTATLCFTELSGNGWRARARRVVAHLAAAAAVLGAVVLLYAVLIRLAYGAFPDYGQSLVYQRLYFAAGFMKIPMTWPGTWALVALAYLSGLAYAAFALVARQPTPWAQIVFLISVLGIGLSSYYQGRSHPNVLLLVWWPCHLLLALFLDDLVSRLGEWPTRLAPWLAIVAISWFMAGSVCGLVLQARPLTAVLAAKVRTDWASKGPRQRAQEITLLRQCVPAGHRVFIVSAQSAFLHLASGHPAFYPSTILQMVRMEEFRDLEGRLARSPTTMLLIDRPMFNLVGWLAENRALRQLVAMLQEHYELAAAGGDAYLFARRDGARLLGPEVACPFRIAIRCSKFGEALKFGAYSPQPPWSLEAVIRPCAEQVPCATVVGNHPGKGTGGFVLHYESADSCAGGG